MKKYELTNETMEFRGHTLHRIRAVRDILSQWIHAGDLDGWIESEENLSHSYSCWVDHEAKVFGQARVLKKAGVYQQAIVCDQAVVEDNAVVTEHAEVGGNAHLNGRMHVDGYEFIKGDDIVTVFTPATRNKAKLRLALTGVSGAGKTLGALYIAYGMTSDWGKVALIDTEHERARFYANRSDLGTGSFLWASFLPPYSAERYKEFVNHAAQSVGSDGVVIVDSFSHAWKNEGGILDVKEKIADKYQGNEFRAWNDAGKIQDDLVNTLLSIDCHIIVTMRSKMAYAMQPNERGKVCPVKIGKKPIQRKNIEYEFDIVLDIDDNHVATASKDTTFLDNYGAIITPELGKQLAAWLNDGTEPPRCTICKQVIKSTKSRSVEQIVAGTQKEVGRPMCMACYKKWAKEHETATEVSNPAN